MQLPRGERTEHRIDTRTQLAGDDGIGHVYPATLNGMVEKAKEILQNTILPFTATVSDTETMPAEQLREKQNAYIKRCLDANMAVSNIAFLAELSPEEVTLRIEELKMTHKV